MATVVRRVRVWLRASSLSGVWLLVGVIGDLFGEAVAQAGAGAVEQGTGGGLGAVEDAGELGGGELVDGGEEEDGAFFRGEAVDGVEGGGELLVAGEELIGGWGAGDEGVGCGVVDLVGATAAAVVDGAVEGEADEPDAWVVEVGEAVGALLLEGAEEDLLDDVFGFGGVADRWRRRRGRGGAACWWDEGG